MDYEVEGLAVFRQSFEKADNSVSFIDHFSSTDKVGIFYKNTRLARYQIN